MAQKISILIDGDNVSILSAVDGTVTALKKLDKKTKETGGIFGEVSKLINKNWAGISIASAITGLGLLIKNAIDLGDKFHDMAQKTGIATETLSVLDYAARMNGTDIDVLSKLFTRFSKNIYEADQGTGKAVDTFKTFGVTLRNSQGNIKSIDELLLDVTKKYKDMPDGVQKAALAQNMFGKAGAESIPILNDLSQNFEKYKKQLQDVGGIITTDFANNADKLKDDLTTLNYAIKGVGISLATDLLPSLTMMSTILVQNATQTEGSIGLTNMFGVAIKSVAIAVGAAAAGLIVYAEMLGTYYAVIIKILTLHPADAWSALNSGLSQIKRTALEAGKIFDAMVNPSKYQAQVDAMSKATQQQEELAIQTQKALDAAKKKAEEFKKVSDEINFQISLFGLSEIDKKVAQITKKFQDLKQQFGDKPILAKGLMNETDMALAEYYEAQMQKLWDKEDKRIKDREKKLAELYKYKMESRQADIDDEEDVIQKAIDLEDFRMRMLANTFDSMADTMMMSFEQAGGASEAWFNFYKTMKIAETVVSTISSAQKSYDWAAAWGGPIAGAIAAAVAVTSGMARVGQITSVGPGSVSGGSGGGSASSVSMPTSASAIQNNSTSNSTQTIVHKTLNINGGILDVQNFLRDHRSDIQRFFNDGNLNLGDA